MIYYLAILIPLGICAILYGLNKYLSQRHEKDVDSDIMMTGIYDKNLKCLEIRNPIPEISLGINNSDFIGENIRSLPKFVLPQNREEAELIANNIILTSETNKPRYFEYSCQFDNGDIHHALCYVYKHRSQIKIKIFPIKERNIFDSQQIFQSESINPTIENIAVGIYVREYGDDKKEYIFENSLAKKYYNSPSILSSFYWNQEEDDNYDELVIARNTPITFNLRTSDVNGSDMYLKVVKRKTKNDSDSFSIVTTLIDQTTHVEAEKDLRYTHSNLQLVLDSAEESIWKYVINEDKFVYLYGSIYVPDGASLNDYIDSISENRKKEVAAIFKELISGKKDKALLNSHFYDKETNSDYYYESSLLLKRNASGVPAKILGTFKDISKQVFEKKKRDELAYRYSTIFHSINVGIGVRDIDGRLIDFNTKFLESYGVADADEFVKINTELNTAIIPREVYRDYIDKKPSTHIIHYNYNKVKYKTNRRGVGIFEVTINPMIDDNDVFVGLVTLISEITDQYNSQKEIQEARENLDIALDAGGIAAWVYDVSQSTFFTLHGDALAGEGITIADNNKILHPDDVRVQKDILSSLIKGEKTHDSAIFRYIGANNEYNAYESYMVAKKNEKGEVTHVMGTQKDLSEEIRKNKELKNILRKNEYILNNINSAIVYIDTNYNVIWGNISEFIKDKFTTALRPYETGSVCYESLGAKSPCPDCLLHRALISGKTESKQIDLKEEGKTLEVFATPVSGDFDYSDGAIIRIDEITERKNLYSQLEDSRNKAEETSALMNNIFDKLPCLLFIKDITDDYRYILANDFFCRATGFPSDNLLGRTDFELFEPGIANKFREDDITVISTGGLYNYDEEVVWGGIRYVWQTSKYVIEARNGHRMLIGLSLDVTDKVDAFRDLEKEKNRAEEADRLKSAFLANMSHEIRTPLNAIVGFSDLLQNTSDIEERDSYMNIININNDLLLGLINDILDLSKIEAGMIELVRTQFDLVPFFAEFSASLKQKVISPNVEFIEVNPYHKCVVTLDRNRLAQVFTNFANNSIKFTSKGFIKMGYEYVDDGIRIFVQDTGIGIPKEKHSRVFQRFEKLNTFTQGTGLGLSICEAIIKTSDGKIGFESEEGVGSTFWAWIKCDAEIE